MKDKIVEILKRKAELGIFPPLREHPLNLIAEEINALCTPDISEEEIDWDVISNEFWERFAGVPASHQSIIWVVFTWMKHRISLSKTRNETPPKDGVNLTTK